MKKKKRRLKRWVRVVLYIIIVGGLSVKAFCVGEEFGLELCQKYETSEQGNNEEIQNINENQETDKENESNIDGGSVNVTEENEKNNGEIDKNEENNGDIIEDGTSITDAPYVIDTLILVNKEHPLPKNYEVELKTMYDKVNRAAKEAYGPLNDMLKAGRAEGLAFEICSSYRDIKVQEELFQEDVDRYMQQGYSYEEAYVKAAEYTMPPGHSEHSTGLAFDIVSLGYQLLDSKQEQTAETQWLHEHCAEYGFILRYPKGKEDITKISYESWHYRYVGVEVATYIMEQGITLEEYLELVLGRI